MKKFLGVLLVVMLITSHMCTSAETPYTSLINSVMADDSVDMSLIDESGIIYAEITSYINLSKGIKPTSFYLYMPSLDGKDYYTAGFDKNEYVATTKNFVATEPLKYYSVNEAKEFATNNGLSEPTEIKAILTHGRIGLFAYSIVCDGKDYIIPYYFTDDSTYNITKDNTVRLSLGTAYTIDEFVSISEKEHTRYDEYMNTKRDKDNRPTVSLNKNNDVNSSSNTPSSSGSYKALKSLGNYGDIEYIYDNMEVSYDYNGERVYLNSEHMTYKELETLLTVFSDEKLSFKDTKITEGLETTDALFPKKCYVEFLDENDGNWIIAFDEKEVYARCIDPINKINKNGFFAYKPDFNYGALRAFFDNIVERETCDIEDTPSTNPGNTPTEPNTPSESETEKHENQINVYDMKQIYEASFPLGNFGDDFSWGICSYTRENTTTPVTVAYLTFEGMEFLRVLTENEIKNNKIDFDNKRVAYFEKGNDGIEYDMDFGITNSFELQININDNSQVEYAVMSYQNNMYDGAPIETEVIDMSKYKQSGYLPTSGKISFEKKYNLDVEEKANHDFTSELLKKEKDSLMNFVSLMEEDSYIAIKLFKTVNDYGARHTYVEKSNKTDLTNFINGLFAEIEKQKTGVGTMSSDKVSYCDFKLRYKENSKWITSNFEIQISNDSVYITNQNSGSNSAVAVAVKDASKIIDYIYEYSKNKFSSFENKNSEDTIDPELYGTIKGLTKTDVIDFEFKQSVVSNDYIAKNISTPGKTIKAVFERYKDNNYKSTYILKLSGDLGEVSLWKKNQSSLSRDEEIYSNNIPISFSTYCRSEGEKLFNYGTLTPYDKYDLKLIFRDNDIYEVYFDNAKCSNLKYAQLTDDKKLAEEFIEKDKEVVLREAQECADTLYGFGLFKGTDKGYELKKSLTREESATILVRLLGEEEKVDADDFDEVFVDVDKDRWSYAYVMYCYKHNITKGTGADTFSPDVQTDANQFITLIMRLLGYTEVNPDTALEKSVEYKLLPQEKIDELTKKKVFTRSDMVQIVYNSLKTQMDDETVFADYLLEKGILTVKEIEQIK